MNLLQAPNFKPVVIEPRRPQLAAKLVMPSLELTYTHQLVFDYARERIDVYCGYDDGVTYIFKDKLPFKTLILAAAGMSESWITDCVNATLSLHDARYRVESKDLEMLARMTFNYPMPGERGSRVAYNLKDGVLTSKEILL